MGFAFVLVLLVVFGFVVYKKIEHNRAERGNLLAGTQAEEQTPEAAVQPTSTAQNPIEDNRFRPPQQTGDPFPEPQPEPAEMTPASWNNQSFEPVSEQQTAGTSIEQFPTEAHQDFGPPTEVSTSEPFPSDPVQQSTVAASSATQTATQPEEFNPTPFPETEVAQAPVPQGFEPPAEFGNPTQAQPQKTSTAPTPVEQGGGDFSPFGNAGTPAEPQQVSVPAVSQNEQFSTESQPVPQEIAQTPQAESPFGEVPMAQTSQSIPQELPQSQSVTEVPAGDPFGTAPRAESMPANAVAQPNEVAVENDPRFGDFQPAPVPNQYEANPQSIPNELPSDVFAQVSSSQLSSDGANGYGQMQPSDRPEVYVVRPGDNYWQISKKQYGTVRYFMALARYNQPRIPDPKKMRPGMKVLTPTRELLESRNPDLFPKYAAKTASIHSVAHRGGAKAGFYLDANGAPMYRVGADDTLGGIAQKHLGRFSRWVEIYQINQHRLKDPNALTLGDVLELPADASRVSMVRQASGIR